MIMELSLKNFDAKAKLLLLTQIFTRKNAVQDHTAHDELIDELELITLRLNNIKTLFDLTVDGDIIDSLIYEENALRHRYDALIKQARAQGVSGQIYRKRRRLEQIGTMEG